MRSEQQQVEAWRAWTLGRAGYPYAAAGRLAADPDVDLHAACRLLERGCPLPVALRILAPAEGANR